MDSTEKAVIAGVGIAAVGAGAYLLLAKKGTSTGGTPGVPNIMVTLS